MAIPASGPLSVSAFNTELGRSSTSGNSELSGGSTPAVGSLVYIAGQQGTLNQAAPHAFSEWYGYAVTTTTTTTAAPAGITFVGSTSTTGTSITLPTGLLQNDIVVLCGMSPSTAQNLVTGYTNGQNGTSNTVRYRWMYKRMGVTPDTTATGLASTSVTIAIVFRGVNVTTLLDVASPAIATDDRDEANPPSITTTTNNSMVVAVAFQDQQATLTAPTNFTLAGTANRSGGTVAAAYRLKTPAGAENPGVFGPGTLDSSWVGATFALRPV
jgi:hypothetical protein